MLSVIQDLADRILDRVLGIDSDDELDDELSRLAQSPSPQLRRIGEILSALDRMDIEAEAALAATAPLRPPTAAIQDLQELPDLTDPLPADPLPAHASPRPAAPSPQPAITPETLSFTLSENKPSPKDLILDKITQAIANSASLVETPPSNDMPQAAIAPAAPPRSRPTQSAPPQPSPDNAAALSPVRPASQRGSEGLPIFKLLQDVTAIAQAWQQELEQLQAQQGEDPVFKGWLEAEHAPDGSPQYRLCSVHETGRILSRPCPLNQVAPVRQAIARYHQHCHLRDRQRALQHQLNTLTAVLTCLLHHIHAQSSSQS